MFTVTLTTDSVKMTNAIHWLFDNIVDWNTCVVLDNNMDALCVSGRSYSSWKRLREHNPGWGLPLYPQVIAVFGFDNKEDALKFKLTWS